MKSAPAAGAGSFIVSVSTAAFRVTGKASEVQAQDCEHHSASCGKCMEIWCMGAIVTVRFEEDG